MRNHVRSMNYYGDKPYRLQPVNTANIKTDSYHGEYDRSWLVRKLSYTDPYDIVIQARSLGDDGGLKSAIKHILDIYNYNNINPLPVNF